MRGGFGNRTRKQIRWQKPQSRRDVASWRCGEYVAGGSYGDRIRE